MNIGLNPGPRARTVKPGPRHLRTRPDPGQNRLGPHKGITIYTHVYKITVVALSVLIDTSLLRFSFSLKF